MAVNLKGDIPIIIGTIPLRRDFNLLTQRRATISTECFRENSETEYRDIQPVATAPFLDYPDLRKIILYNWFKMYFYYKHSSIHLSSSSNLFRSNECITEGKGREHGAETGEHFNIHSIQ